MDQIDQEITGEILKYDYDPEKQLIHRDVDGEILEGFYYGFVNKESGEPISGPIGPYSSFDEAHEALIKAWEDGDF